jgi:IS5 family transposase
LVRQGSKDHLLTDADGVSLACMLTAANVNDMTQLLVLVQAVPPVRGRPGRPRRRPDRVVGDRGYDSERHRRALRARGILPELAHRGDLQPALGLTAGGWSGRWRGCISSGSYGFAGSAAPTSTRHSCGWHAA